MGKVDKIKAKVPKVTFVPSVLSAPSVSNVNTTQVRPPGCKRPIVLRARPQATNSAEPEWTVEAILGEKKEGNRRLYVKNNQKINNLISR